MVSYQAQELEARIKLSEALSEKGKEKIWRVCRTYTRNNKRIFDFESQEPLNFKLSFSVNQ